MSLRKTVYGSGNRFSIRIWIVDVEAVKNKYDKGDL